MKNKFLLLLAIYSSITVASPKYDYSSKDIDKDGLQNSIDQDMYNPFMYRLALNEKGRPHVIDKYTKSDTIYDSGILENDSGNVTSSPDIKVANNGLKFYQIFNYVYRSGPYTQSKAKVNRHDISPTGVVKKISGPLSDSISYKSDIILDITKDGKKVIYRGKLRNNTQTSANFYCDAWSESEFTNVKISGVEIQSNNDGSIILLKRNDSFYMANKGSCIITAIKGENFKLSNDGNFVAVTTSERKVSIYQKMGKNWIMRVEGLSCENNLDFYQPLSFSISNNAKALMIDGCLFTLSNSDYDLFDYEKIWVQDKVTFSYVSSTSRYFSVNSKLYIIDENGEIELRFIFPKSISFISEKARVIHTQNFIYLLDSDSDGIIDAYDDEYLLHPKDDIDKDGFEDLNLEFTYSNDAYEYDFIDFIEPHITDPFSVIPNIQTFYSFGTIDSLTIWVDRKYPIRNKISLHVYKYEQQQNPKPILVSKIMEANRYRPLSGELKFEFEENSTITNGIYFFVPVIHDYFIGYKDAPWDAPFRILKGSFDTKNYDEGHLIRGPLDGIGPWRYKSFLDYKFKITYSSLIPGFDIYPNDSSKWADIDTNDDGILDSPFPSNADTTINGIFKMYDYASDDIDKDGIPNVYDSDIYTKFIYREALREDGSRSQIGHLNLSISNDGLTFYQISDYQDKESIKKINITPDRTLKIIEEQLDGLSGNTSDTVLAIQGDGNGVYYRGNLPGGKTFNNLYCRAFETQYSLKTGVQQIQSNYDGSIALIQIDGSIYMAYAIGENGFGIKVHNCTITDIKDGFYKLSSDGKFVAVVNPDQSVSTYHRIGLNWVLGTTGLKCEVTSESPTPSLSVSNNGDAIMFKGCLFKSESIKDNVYEYKRIGKNFNTNFSFLSNTSNYFSVENEMYLIAENNEFIHIMTFPNIIKFISNDAKVVYDSQYIYLLDSDRDRKIDDYDDNYLTYPKDDSDKDGFIDQKLVYNYSTDAYNYALIDTIDKYGVNPLAKVSQVQSFHSFGIIESLSIWVDPNRPVKNMIGINIYKFDRPKLYKDFDFTPVLVSTILKADRDNPLSGELEFKFNNNQNLTDGEYFFVPVLYNSDIDDEPFYVLKGSFDTLNYDDGSLVNLNPYVYKNDYLNLDYKFKITYSSLKLGFDVFPNNPSLWADIDTDNDGLLDSFDNDDDNDGLSDIKELAVKLNPLEPDTDGDGILDINEKVSFELISSFPNLVFNMYVIDDNLSINDSYIRLVAPSKCYVETAFNNKTKNIASLAIPLHPNAISGEYHVSVQNGGISKQLFFNINNLNQDITQPELISYDVIANPLSDVVTVINQFKGIDTGLGVNDPWINSKRLNYEIYVGDYPDSYVGNITYLQDALLNNDIYIITSNHNLLPLHISYKEAPTVDYVRICEQSYNGTEYIVDTDGDNALDIFDIQPNNPAIWIDLDKDGFDNSIDNCPLTPNKKQTDFDLDTVGDICDIDDDNDGALDLNDAFPLDAKDYLDSDNDGLGDNYELDNGLSISNPDFDGDGLKDGEEVALGTNPKIGDSDDDGVIDGNDKFPLISIGALLDSDNDGAPDKCDEACLALGMKEDRDGIAPYTLLEQSTPRFASLSPTAKIIVTSSEGENFFDVAKYVSSGTSDNPVTVVGETFLISGSSEIDGFMVQPGVKYDLTNLKGGIDKLYFSGPLAEYAESILLDPATGVMQVSRLTDVGEEVVQFIATASAADTLIFTDGALSAANVKAAVSGQTPLTDLTLDTSNKALDDKTVTGATVKHIVLSSEGGSVMGLGPSIKTLISGNSGIDQIYVPTGSIVDASNLKSGRDEITLEGNLADYDITLNASGNIVLNREVDIDDVIHTEEVTVANGGNVATNDLVIFADQQLDTSSIKQQL